MASQTGIILNSEIMADSVKILTTNPGFLPRRAQKSVLIIENDKISAEHGYTRISGCRLLSQSPGPTFFQLAVIDNPRFAAIILVLSDTVP